MRAALTLVLACAGLGVSLAASGQAAKNHEAAERLHELQRECELRRAAIANMRVQVRGRVAGDPRRATIEAQARQDGGGVSGSKSLGGSPVVDPGTSTRRIAL